MNSRGNVLQFCVGFTCSVGVYMYMWQEVQQASVRKLTLLSFLEKELNGETHMRSDQFDLSALTKPSSRKSTLNLIQMLLGLIK